MTQEDLMCIQNVVKNTIQEALIDVAGKDDIIRLETRMEDLGTRMEDMDTRMEDLGTRMEDLGTRMEKLEVRMEDMDTRMEKLEVRMEDLDTRLEKLEVRMEDLDTRLEKLEARVGSLETRVGGLETRVDGLEMRMDSMNKYMHKQFLMIENELVPKVNTLYEMAGRYITKYQCKQYREQIGKETDNIDPLMYTLEKHGEQLENHDGRIKKLEVLA